MLVTNPATSYPTFVNFCGKMVPMATSSYPAFVSFCGKMAPLASLALFFAPMPTIRGVTKDKSVGNLPLLPHTTMISNAFLWVAYGALRKEPSVWGANGLGILLSMYYFTQFLKYAPKEAATLPGKTRTHVKAALAAVGIISAIALALPNDQAATAIGNLGVAVCILLFASPLVALKTVIQTKSAESIPLSFTMASIACCFFWSIVGLKKMNDWVIYLPNLLGLSFGLMQLALKLFYGNDNSSSKDIKLAI